MPLAAHAPGLLRRRKFHSTFKHWIQCIRDFGAPYLYSGEANEEFHKVACKVCNPIGGLRQVSSRGLADIWREVVHCRRLTDVCQTSVFLQWAYRLTNKVTYEDQMVNKIHELDGMTGLTADVPELKSLPGKGGPAKTLRSNLDFAGML